MKFKMNLLMFCILSLGAFEAFGQEYVRNIAIFIVHKKIQNGVVIDEKSCFINNDVGTIDGIKFPRYQALMLGGEGINELKSYVKREDPFIFEGLTESADGKMVPCSEDIQITRLEFYSYFNDNTSRAMFITVTESEAGLHTRFSKSE